jgi:hypothetical protein
LGLPRQCHELNHEKERPDDHRGDDHSMAEC